MKPLTHSFNENKSSIPFRKGHFLVNEFSKNKPLYLVQFKLYQKSKIDKHRISIHLMKNRISLSDKSQSKEE